jgi:molybdopterin-binding protein
MSIEKINARNQFKGKISNIILGDVVSEVDVDTPSGIVTSVITTRSVKDLELKNGGFTRQITVIGKCRPVDWPMRHLRIESA